MSHEAPGTKPGRPGKHSPGFEIAWQSALVLSFLTLFWTLAWLSPWTDKSHPLALVGGAVILALLWIPVVAIMIKQGEWRPVSARRLIQDNPQLWIVTVYLILAARDINVIPTCDNGAYFRMVLGAVERFNFVLGDSLAAMKLAGHPAQAYAAYMMLGQFLGFTRFQIANLQMYILHVIGILAFSGIVGQLFPGRARAWERLLATALFAFTPLAYGLSLTVSPDFAVLALLCLVIWAIQRDYAVLAVATGVMLCFTKEAGALLYAGLVLGAFGFLVPYQAWHSPISRARALATRVGKNLYLGLPLLLYAFYIAKDGQLWIFQSAQDLAASTRLLRIEPWNVWDKTVQMFLANFNWLVWGVIGASIPIGFLRNRRGGPQAPGSPRTGPWFVVLGVAIVPFVLVNYIFVTWNNARYVLPVCLFATLFLLKALERLWVQRGLRIEMLAICLVVSGASSFRTFDPLLVRAFTTFRFGEHQMSFYNSTETVCDLTAYNHEYVYYNRLFDRFLAEASFNPAADEFVFFTGDSWADFANHNVEYLWTGGRLLGPLYVDPVSMTRTYAATGNPVLRSTIFVRGESDPSSLPKHAFSIEPFWIQELRDLSVSEMRKYYKVTREIHVEEDGYALVGYELLRTE